MFLKKRYEVSLELTHTMLGTNPQNPSVHGQFIIERQRKLIAEKSDINKALNKYHKAKKISEEQRLSELDGLFKRIEEVLGRELSAEEREDHLSGAVDIFDELKETFESLKDHGTTVFFRTDKGTAAIGSHVIMGFLKAASETYSRTQKLKQGTMLKSKTYSHSMINQYVTVTPHLIESSIDLERDPDGNPIFLERSLRAMTPKGPRISLAKSEQVRAGAQFTFYMEILGGVDSGKEVFPITIDDILTLLEYGETKGLGQWRNAGHGTFKVLGIKRVPLVDLPAKKKIKIIDDIEVPAEKKKAIKKAVKSK